MLVSSRLSGLLQTSQEHPRADAASKRLKMEECLPLDVLEQIMGCLDRETLRTARLVSKTICAAASAHVCSVKLHNDEHFTAAFTSKAVPFHRLPHLRDVTVWQWYQESESLAELDPRIRDLATSLATAGHHASKVWIKDYLSHAALMPKLRKLEVAGNAVMCEAALLASCTNVQAIDFPGCSISVAKTIVTMTQLTSLHIAHVCPDDRKGYSEDVSWLRHATNLRSLKALCTSTTYEAMPLIGILTGLTGLTLSPWVPWHVKATCSIAPLTRLTRLRSLSFGQSISESNLVIACSLGLGALINLELQVCKEASDDCGRFLSCQTALTKLVLRGGQLCNLRHIGALRVELLQSVELFNLDVADAEGPSVLCRATALTKLTIYTGIADWQTGLSQVLAGLTQLRSLGWHQRRGGDFPFLPSQAKDVVDFPLELSPLTGLTKLKISCEGLDDGDLRALLVLTGLCVLELYNCRLTNEVVPELGRLTNLKRLTVWDCGVTCLEPVSRVIRPLRRARGLRYLSTQCSKSKPPSKRHRLK